MANPSIRIRVADPDLFRRLSSEEINQEGNRWYLTHHGATHEFEPNRVRVVCNASASFKGFCLKLKLLSDPNLLNDLPGVITRFLVTSTAVKTAVSSYIIKFFHHVKMPLRDQQLLRYLWRNPTGTSVTQTLGMTRHLFGAASSPFFFSICASSCSQRQLGRSF